MTIIAAIYVILVVCFLGYRLCQLIAWWISLSEESKDGYKHRIKDALSPLLCVIATLAFLLAILYLSKHWWQP